MGRLLRNGQSEDNQLCVYVDTGWGNDVKECRRSRSDIMINYGDTPIYAYIQFQNCLSLSSTEAE